MPKSKLELWYPSKPFVTTQAWGVYNPAYLQFGFDHHNGIDFLPGADQKLYCPVKNLRVLDCGFQKDMGNYIRAITDDVYDFNGVKAKIYMVFMHGKELPTLNKEQLLQVGDFMMIQDNTGFSTGPHTHWYCAKVDPTTLIDLENNNANSSFDQAPYCNKYYAVDSYKVLGLLNAIIKALTDFIDNWKKQA